MTFNTSHINKKEVKPINPVLKSGIYKILNTKNEKCYIGSAVLLSTRFNTHKSFLRNNRHPNKHLQSSWNKHSGWNFEFVIIEYCEKEKLLEREQYYLDALQPEYNIRKDAKSNVGINFGKQTIEHIEKRMLKIRGGKHSEEARLNNSNAQKGKKLQLHVKAILASYLNRPSSEQKKLKIGISNSKPEKWPHKLRSKCPCRECADKRNLMRRNFNKYKNNVLSTAIFVENINV